MKNIYFFSCENIAIISSRALQFYPRIEHYVYTYVRPVKSVLFFAVKEPFVTKNTFNTSTPTGFASIVIEKDHVHISPLLAIDNHVKQRLLEYISNFFTIPIVIEVDLTKPDWYGDVTFLASLGFGNPTPNHGNLQSIDMKFIPGANYAETLNQAFKITHAATFLCRSKVFFPKTLADTLSSYLSEPIEVGGKICITRYAKDNQGGDIAVLGFNTSEIIQGNKDSFTVDIPPDKSSPFSFHTHPDTCYTSFGCFLGWPSGPDISFVVTSFLQNNNILAHFVVSSEGLWVIHLRPQFQKLLYELKNQFSTEDCQRKLEEFIRQSFIFLEGQRRYEIIAPLERAETREKFLDISTKLKISDFKGTDVEVACAPFVREDALLFDLRLIKWKAFNSNRAIMEFSYIVDPVGGLPCKLPIDCNVLTNVITEMDMDTIDDMEEDAMDL